MGFLNPSSLWLLALVPPLAVALAWVGQRRHRKFTAQFGESHLVSRFSQLLSNRKAVLKALCACIALSAAIVACARPYINDGQTSVPVGTVDVVTVIDVSRSMAIESYPGKTPGFPAGTRLDMAKDIVLDRLMPELGPNRLGIVTYSGSALPQAFLSSDMDALTWMIKTGVTVGSAPGDGTNMTTGLNLADELFKLDSDDHHTKVIVLFTDGDFYDTQAQIQASLALLRQDHIQLVVVGVGTSQALPIPIDQLNANDQAQYYGQRYYEDAGGQIQRIPYNYQNMISLKDEADARYVQVANVSDFNIADLLSGHTSVLKKGQQEIFFYPLLLALIFFGLCWLIQRERSEEFADVASLRRSASGLKDAPRRVLARVTRRKEGGKT